MKVGRFFLAIVAGLVMAVQPLPAWSVGLGGSYQTRVDVATITSRAADGGPGGGDGSPQPDGGVGAADGWCRPGTPAAAPPTGRYHADNRLFGPRNLPSTDPVGALLTGYQRFGGLSQQDWNNAFTVGPAHDAYLFPPLDGFALAPDGRPIKAAQRLLPGYRLDRFGFPGGAFLSPLGTPFGGRALPPDRLNTPPATPPGTVPSANYHVYCVIRSFTEDSGPIAPWFAQPGWGTQFKLNRQYLPQAGAALSITWLLDHHYLVEEDFDPNAAPGSCASRVEVVGSC